MSDTFLGFTQTPNVVFDYFMSELTPAEFMVLSAVCRKTYGWHKKDDSISISQFIDMTKMSINTVRASLRSLIKIGVVVKTKDCDKKNAARYKINIDYRAPDFDQHTKNQYSQSQDLIPKTQDEDQDLIPSEDQDLIPQNKVLNKVLNKHTATAEGESNPKKERVPQIEKTQESSWSALSEKEPDPADEYKALWRGMLGNRLLVPTAEKDKKIFFGRTFGKQSDKHWQQIMRDVDIRQFEYICNWLKSGGHWQPIFYPSDWWRIAAEFRHKHAKKQNDKGSLESLYRHMGMAF